jgi:hypothetical protein
MLCPEDVHERVKPDYHALIRGGVGLLRPIHPAALDPYPSAMPPIFTHPVPSKRCNCICRITE